MSNKGDEMSVLITSGQDTAVLDLKLGDSKNGALLTINGADFPIAIDMQGGVVTVSVWEVAGKDDPCHMVDLKNYVCFGYDEALKRAYELLDETLEVQFVVQWNHEDKKKTFLVMDAETFEDTKKERNYKILARVNLDGTTSVTKAKK